MIFSPNLYENEQKTHTTQHCFFSNQSASRREVSLFLPTEPLDEYTNKDEIKTAYRKAKKRCKNT